MNPAWRHLLSIASLTLAGLCALVVAVDVARRPQHMWIMNVVWPVTALFGSVVWRWLYLRYEGRQGGLALRQRLHAGRHLRRVARLRRPGGRDLVRLALAFGERMFAVWVLDHVFAFVIGIAFQYFTIRPMRHLSVGEGLW